MIERGNRAVETLSELLKHPNYLVRVNLILGLRESLFLG
jgi:hypothetical protein